MRLELDGLKLKDDDDEKVDEDEMGRIKRTKWIKWNRCNLPRRNDIVVIQTKYGFSMEIEYYLLYTT